MRVTLILLAAALGGAGCDAGSRGPNSRALLMADCQKQNTPVDECECIVSVMEEKLPADLFARTARAVGSEGQNVYSYIRQLPVEDQLAFGALTDGWAGCRLTGILPQTESPAE
jgi:hypothetical protein